MLKKKKLPKDTDRKVSKNNDNTVDNNRRTFPRLNPENLWAREKSGDFMYISKVINISQSGILLEKRFVSNLNPSELTLTSKTNSITLLAQPLEERTQLNGKSSAYCFVNLTSNDNSILKNMLKELR